MGWQGLCRSCVGCVGNPLCCCSHDSSTAIPAASLNCVHPRIIKICLRILRFIFKVTHFTDEEPEAG